MVPLIVLGALDALVWLPYGLDGGFHYDDWANAAAYHYADGFLGGVDAINPKLGGRPVLAFVLTVPHAAFGQNPELHLVFGLLLGLAVAACFYALLRRLGLELAHALAISALALIYPWSDATKLWATAAVNNLPVLLFLGGALAALNSLERPTGRTVWRAVAVGLYFASVLIYEAAAGLILLTPLLYSRHLPVRQSIRRALPEIAAVVVAALLVGRAEASIDLIPAQLKLYVKGFPPLFTSSALPVDLSPGARAAALAVITAAIVLVGWRLTRSIPENAEARRWAKIGGLAALAIAAGYIPFLLSGLLPDAQGINNRVNLVAALGIVTLVYSLLAFSLAVVVPRDRFLDPRRRFALPVAALAIAIGYAVQIRSDEERWEQATHEQDAVLEAVGDLPRPGPHDVIYVTGFRAETAPNVPVFLATEDMSGAARLLLRQPTVVAYPVFSGARLVCTETGVDPVALPAPYYDLDEFRGRGGRYGRIAFVDARTGLAKRIQDRRACSATITRLNPGPPSGLDGR